MWIVSDIFVGDGSEGRDPLRFCVVILKPQLNICVRDSDFLGF